VDGDYKDLGTFQTLRKELGRAGRPAYYLAIPPVLFGKVVEQLAKSGCTDGARVIIEKPFGRDLASAQELNRVLLAVAQAGLTWAHFDQVTQAFGLACTGPIISMMTGIAGFTLGGGFGWVHRKIGLGCDSLKSATVVTADGNLVTANEADNRLLQTPFYGFHQSRPRAELAANRIP
jgi:hypothetical protein